MTEDEFDDFYATSFTRVTGQLYAMIGNRDEAQECVQEAFVRAWSHRRQLDRDRSPEAWVRTTAHRLAMSRWRRTVRGHRAPDRALQPAQQGTPPDAEPVALVAALRQLPEPQRRALSCTTSATCPCTRWPPRSARPRARSRRGCPAAAPRCAVLRLDGQDCYQ